EEHVARAGDGDGHLPQLGRALAKSVVDERRHEGGAAHEAGPLTAATKSRRRRKSPSGSAPGRNSRSATASGAPTTTRGAPSDGMRAACSIESPPTAWRGRLTAARTAARSSSGERRPS